MKVANIGINSLAPPQEIRVTEVENMDTQQTVTGRRKMY